MVSRFAPSCIYGHNGDLKLHKAGHRRRRDDDRKWTDEGWLNFVACWCCSCCWNASRVADGRNCVNVTFSASSRSRDADRKTLRLPFKGHIKTGQQSTITHQYGDWYTGHWPLGCYAWYSNERPGRAVAPHSPLLAVPNVTARPSTDSVY